MHALLVAVMLGSGDFDALLNVSTQSVAQQDLPWDAYAAQLQDMQPRASVWYVGAKWCPNCPVAKADLQRNGVVFKTGNRSTWRHWDYDKHAAMFRKLGVRSLPAVLIMRDSKPVKVWNSYPGFPAIQQELKQNQPARGKPVQAWPMGSLPLKREATQTIDAMTAALGSSGSMTIALRRGVDAKQAIPVGNGATIKLPRELVTEYKLQNGQLVIQFLGQQPSIRIGSVLPVEVEIGGFTIGTDKATLRLDWAPDVSWRLN